MFRVAICDDEPVFCSQLKLMLADYEGACELQISEFHSATALYAFLTGGHQVELILLDIEMPGLDGVELGVLLREQLRDDLTQVIYISGTQGYERKLFDAQPLNFLTKPVERRKLFRCLSKAIDLNSGDAACFCFTSNKCAYRIRYRDIRYFENYKRQIIIHTVKGESSYYGRLEALALPPDFLRIHQSFCVNCRYVRTIKFDHIIMDNENILPVSRAYQKDVTEKFLQMFTIEINT